MKLALHWKIIIGLLLGVIWAVLSGYLGMSEFTANWIAPFGTLFIRVLKLIAVPLVFFSIISGVSGLGDPASLGRLGLKTLGMYFLTTVVAVTLGLVLVNTISPGKLMDEESRVENRLRYEIWANDQDIAIKDDRNYLQKPQYRDKAEEIADKSSLEIPDAAVQSKIETAEKTKQAGPLQPLVDLVPPNIFGALGDNGSMLQIIFFAIFFGICLVLIPQERGKPLKQVVDSIMEVFLKMVDVIMKAAPVFVFALLAGEVSKMAGDDVGKVLEIFKGLSWYSLTVFAGLAAMVAILYPLIMHFFVKSQNYRGFLKGISPAQTLAFSTSSSAATLPVTMECVEDNLGVDKKITSFVLPIGATVNMDGTSLYQAVAVVFLAQMHMIDLTLAQQLTIVVTATLASIGSAAVPSAGLVMLIIVLESVGLNPAWIAIILPVDRILDMCRTVVNVTGDASVSTIIGQSEGSINYGKTNEVDAEHEAAEVS